MNKNFADDALRGLLGQRVPAWARYALVLLATAVFAAFAYNARYAKIDEFTGFRAEELIRFTTVVLAALYALTAAVALHIGRRLNFGAQALFCVVIGVILLAKVSLFDYVSDDYDIFLSGWIYSYSQMGIKEGLGSYIGSDYTPPYLYLLLLISRVKNYPWQYLVKIVSLAFEALMAYAVAKLAGLKVRGDAGRVVLFCLTLMLPTVVFNGAYWGQCDVIYTSLCLLALYHALQKRSAWSMTLFGMALSFKLQTVFFLPTLLPLWLRKDIKLRHLVLIPAAYMAMMIPAFWGGKSLHHVLTVYLAQAGGYNGISINGPSLYNLLPSTMDNGMLYDLFGSMAMALEGYPDLERYAVDGDEPTRLEALGRGVVRAAWPNADDAPVEDMDIIVICLHPEAAADFVRAQAGRIRSGALLTDVCGVKRPLFEAVGEVRERTFIYLGGHPMAGRERGGFAHATADLFRGAHYILTPDAGVPQESIRLMERLVTFMGCADVVFSDPAAHDERIAYTSQLMHVMALALCDQHLLFDSYGFEGGSFRGATRAAALDPKLWCELFWANKETLANLTDELTERLAEYSALLHGDDRAALLERLTVSSDRKKKFDALRGLDASQKPLFK